MTLESQSLNLNARQILIKRLSTTQALDYTGPIGELVLDTTLKLLRIQDGVTPGGILITSLAALTAVQANLQAQINSILSNIDPTAIDSFSEVIANVNALLSNNIESSLVNSGFYANLTNTGNLVVDGSILPKNHLTQDLGAPSRAWRDLYLSGSTAYFSNAAFSITNTGVRARLNGVDLPFIGNIKFPDGSTQGSAVNAADVANLSSLFTPQMAANIANVVSFVGNATAFIGNLIQSAIDPVSDKLDALDANVVLEWTHPVTANVWTTYEHHAGIRVTNIERRTAVTENLISLYQGNLLAEYDSVNDRINVIKVDKTLHANIADIVNGYSLDTIINGNISIAGAYVDVNTIDDVGNAYVFTLTDPITPYANNESFTFTYDTTPIGIPVVWFDANTLPGGETFFRGAIIDYHARSDDSGTLIGTIKIAVDNNKTNVTHSETGSGSTDLANNVLWGRFNDYENKLYYYRSDGVAGNISIHYTAKLFYADYGA